MFNAADPIKRFSFAYISVLLVLIILVLSEYLAVQSAQKINDSSAAEINAAGKQRMLSQRIALLGFALAGSSDQEYFEGIRDDLGQQISLMEMSEEALTMGDDKLGINPPRTEELKDLYFDQQLGLEQSFRAFIDKAHTLAQLNFPDADQASHLVLSSQADILFTLSQELLPKLDAVVRQYQLETEENIRDIKFQSFFFLVIILCLLIFSGIWIFRPIASRLKRHIQEASDYAMQLSEKNREVYRLSMVASQTVNGVIIADINGAVEWVNPGFIKISGYELSELSGRKPGAILQGPDTDQNVVSEIKEALRQQDSFSVKILNYHKSGNPYWVEIVCNPLRNENGDIDGFIAIQTDLSERMKLESQLRQAQRMEAIGQLTGGVAHDFNNLLHVMIGNAEMLKLESGEDRRSQKYVDTIIRAVDRASSLTNRLLSFSRQQILSPVSADVTALIVGLEDMLLRSLGEAIDLKVIHTPDLWLATIDPHQFENALVNLALNARDAMLKGGTLTIETANTTLDETYAEQFEEVTPGCYVKVMVSDTGTGMSPEVLEKVFEPFFTTKEVGKGSGLGLSMVYGFVKQSGGHITIYSEEGDGTTVKLYMPRSEEAQTRDDTKKDTAELQVGSERILIVEDDETVRRVPVTILRDQGYEIVEAGDGKEAIKHLKDGPPFDLLFTDVVLPGGMNGVQIADEAQKIQANIKVLYTTGYTENAVVHQGKLDPGVTLVNKPYRRAELLEKVRQVLDQKGD